MLKSTGNGTARIIACLLIVLGLTIMLFPTLNDFYSAYQQQQLLEDFANQVSAENDTRARESYLELDHLFEQVILEEEESRETDELSSSVTLDETTGDTTRISTAKEIIGRLEIEKIKLQLPILRGATQSNLRYAAGHLDGTASLGEQGNTALAAHRSYTYGKLFNRLDELEEGDEIRIVSPDATYTYTVHKKLLVEPTDVSVLESAKNEFLLTLITCHPMKNPTHRLIVQAKLNTA